jgi:hypothetical protein
MIQEPGLRMAWQNPHRQFLLVFQNPIAVGINWRLSPHAEQITMTKFPSLPEYYYDPALHKVG